MASKSGACVCDCAEDEVKFVAERAGVKCVLCLSGNSSCGPSVLAPRPLSGALADAPPSSKEVKEFESGLGFFGLVSSTDATDGRREPAPLLLLLAS